MESIYKVSRLIKKREQSLYNALRSIYEDSLFVGEIAQLWPELPVLANLRCGLWYAPHFDGVCYFKSTDGHNGNWSFNVTRLNLHVALLAAEKGGCIIVDATRKGKRFPDSMSKTIPIWACVVNRALADLRKTLDTKVAGRSMPQGELHDVLDNQGDARGHDNTAEMASTGANGDPLKVSHPPILQEGCAAGTLPDWDCLLHLPIWVSETEKNNIENLAGKWVDDLKASGADLAPLAKTLRKPLRTLWVSQKTVIWLNEVADVASWDFTPIILVSASRPGNCTQRMSDAEFSWSYIPGAADDEESWARGLTPSLFWKHSDDLINEGPQDCNRKVADIVEHDRVYKALRGQDAPQVKVKSGKKHSAPVDVSGNSSYSVCKSTSTPIHQFVTSKLKDEDTNKSDGACQFENGYQTRPEDRMSQILKQDTCSQNSIVRLTVPAERQPPKNIPNLHWIGSTGLAVGNSACCQVDCLNEVVDFVINCGAPSCSTFSDSEESYLHLPIVSSKFDRHSLGSHLPEAVKSATKKLASGLSVLICCPDGEDISVCVCLAILLSCFDSIGKYCGVAGSADRTVTKSDVRQSLVYLAGFHSGARPSRGSLKQVYNFLLDSQ